jgi:D-alanine-D-alanine ligase
MIPIRPDWWKTLFDEVYLITDARSVCDEALTRREVDFLEGYLALRRSDRILDLCGGQGRHSLGLAKRGYQRLIVFDYSEVLIKTGKACADRASLPIQFLRGDARETGLASGAFDLVLLMANSFGYFPDERDNMKILREAYRVLALGGTLLLDLIDSDYAISNFRPVSWHEATEDIVVCRQREMDNGLLRVQEIVLSKSRGMIRDATYCERIYQEETICEILEDVGFRDISAVKNFSSHTLPGDYGCMTNRMIVTGRHR